MIVAGAARLAALHPVVVVKPQLEAHQRSKLLLPFLGGGHEGRGSHGGSKGKSGKGSGGLRAQSRRGFAYPGPQAIISNPPQAVLGTQTILRQMKNLPQLHRELPLPNLVRPAAAEVADQKPAMKIKSGSLVFHHKRQETVKAPKLKLHVTQNKTALAALADMKPLMPTKAVADPVDPSALKSMDRKQKGLLVLNAIAPPPDVSGKVPLAEERSLFAVTPSEMTTIADPAAGTKAGGQDSAPGSGDVANIARGDAFAELTPAADKNARSSGAGSGNGSGVGNDSGSGLSAKNGTGGKGRGSSSGSGLGTADASGAGTGAGSGSAPGPGGFRGITIQGGRYGNGNTNSMLVKTLRPPQTSYEMTVVSTGRAGGGLPDLGVFHNEQVYTVYLDMRINQDDPTPSWTLQYALLPQVPSDPVDHKVSQSAPTPPYAMLKQVPDYAPELVRKYARRLIIASAVLDESGKLDKLAIVQSPSNEFSAPLLEALQHWMFQPAQLDGHPVALKILLGIRFAVRPIS